MLGYRAMTCQQALKTKGKSEVWRIIGRHDPHGLEADRRVTLRALFPFHCDNDLTSHPPFSLVRYLSATDLRAELWVTGRGPRAREPFVREGLPSGMRWIADNLSRVIQPRAQWTRRITESRFASAFRPGDAAWVYRGCSTTLIHRLRGGGCPVFLERVNTMDDTSRRIIADAFSRAGWPVEPPYDVESPLDADRAHVLAADFVFSPSPAVTDSLLEQGVAREKVLETSYGWDPGRFAGQGPDLPPIDGITVLFVGSIGLRKGAHLLLDAWGRAKIRGRLVLVGRLEPLIARRCTAQLARPDVIHLDYHPDPAPAFRAADLFAFPTLEEGSPLVSYEAIGNGLPVITSAIGAGAIIRHEVEGLIVDPHDSEGLVTNLRRLAEDVHMRKRMGSAARLRAAEYTWEKVAKRRYHLVRSALRSTGAERASQATPAQ
jgi:hypothetical protein